MLFLFLVGGQHRDFTCLLQAMGAGYTESIKIKLRKKLQISIHVSIYECKGGSMIIPPSSKEENYYSPARSSTLPFAKFFSKDSGFIYNHDAADCNRICRRQMCTYLL